MIKIERVYNAPENDGFRILVDRLGSVPRFL